MHPLPHLRAAYQDARNISAGDRCHTSEFLRRPRIEQDEREHKTDTSLQREQAREPV